MPFSSVLITGANRGIGLEFVRQLVTSQCPPNVLIAVCRQSSTELDKISQGHQNVHILNLDVSNFKLYDSFTDRVRSIVSNYGLDLLINNAGILVADNLDTVTPSSMVKHYEINTVAPLMLTRSLRSLLKQSVTMSHRSSLVINIAAGWGSISITTESNQYAYRCSKAALHMVGKCLAVELATDQVRVVSIHPGWVATDMGSGFGKPPLSVEESVSSVMGTIEKLDESSNGLLLNYDGNVIPF